MVKKIYNVILQSSIGDGTTTSNDTYFYDWSLIPNVPYIVTFSFQSAFATFTSGTVVPSIYVDLTQQHNEIAVAQSSTATYRGQFLGNLKYAYGGTAVNALTADVNTNPPTFLNGRPSNNLFTLEIRGTATTEFTPPCGPYCLILSFQEAD
jgi:hypothetical protein